MSKIQKFIDKGIKVLNEVPKGWRVLEGATTAPVGYKWISNGKSFFSKDFESALLKMEELI